MKTVYSTEAQKKDEKMIDFLKSIIDSSKTKKAVLVLTDESAAKEVLECLPQTAANLTIIIDKDFEITHEISCEIVKSKTLDKVNFKYLFWMHDGGCLYERGADVTGVLKSEMEVFGMITTLLSQYFDYIEEDQISKLFDA